MPQLRRLRALLRKGLDETVALWPPIRVAYGYIHKVARLLANEAGLSVSAIRQRLSVVLRQMRASASSGDAPAVGLAHFVKVTRSYRPGSFVCYQVDGVPRTNNDLEQLFGSQRYHERRSNGRRRHLIFNLQSNQKWTAPGLTASRAWSTDREATP